MDIVLSLRSTIATSISPTSIIVKGNYAYVMSNQSRTIDIFDITKPTNPVLKSNTNLDPLSDLFYISGNYLYVTSSINMDNDAGLFIYDISNPILLNLISHTILSNSSYNIYVFGDLAYITTSVNEILILDVTNKSNVIEISKTNYFVVDLTIISIKGNYCYSVDQANKTLTIIDLTQLKNPITQGIISYTNIVIRPDRIFIKNNYAYVLSYNDNIFIVVDISNIANPFVKCQIGIETPTSIFVENNIAYITSGINVLQIYDISGPCPINLLNTAIAGTDIASSFVINQTSYVINVTDSTMMIFENTTPFKPKISGLNNFHSPVKLLGEY
jgi:hypothetical protein